MMDALEFIKAIKQMLSAGANNSTVQKYKHGEQHKGMFTTDRAKNRAKTFPGIARAMAEQWGGDIREEL